MQAPLYFSLMNDIEATGKNKGSLRKGVVSSVVPYATFADVIDLMIWMADENRSHPGHEAYGIVATRFQPCTQHHASYANMRYARKEIYEQDELTFFYIDIDNSKPSLKVNMNQTIARIAAAGLAYVSYTTRSHSAEQHRFRLLFPLDTPVSRDEAKKLAIALNKKWFSGQADLSVYDGADFIYLPMPGSAVSYKIQGTALNTKVLMHEADDLISKNPHLWVGGSKNGAAKVQQKIANAVAVLPLSPAAHDHSVRPDISIQNLEIFSASWLSLYQYPYSHWEAMRTILGKVWKRAEGDLTYGEMRLIFDQVDAVGNRYFLQKYGEQGIEDLIRWFFTLPTTEANDNWKSILSQEDIGLTIDVIEAECGQGKTYMTIGDMVASGENYVFAAPKIGDLSAIRSQIVERFAVKPRIVEIQCEAGTDRVPSQLTQWRKDFDNWDGAPIIVLTTHAAVMMHDWKRWTDFNLIIDEVPETFLTQTINIKNNPETLNRHLRIATKMDGQCHPVKIRQAGREALTNGDFDDSEEVNREMAEYLSGRNTKTWIAADQWDKRVKQAITFFTMISPEKLTGFKSVRILGDEATKSIALRTWAAKWGVKLNKLNAPARPRKVLLGDRLTIRYFAETGDASISLFANKQPGLLRKITDIIGGEHPSENVLWTANERFRSEAEISGGTYITPRTHGRNDLQHHTILVWLAAMKPSTATGAAITGVCGMTYDETVEWREYNCLADLVAFLSDIQSKGCDLYLHQQAIDTSTPSGKMMFQMLGVFSEFERAMIRSRVKAGLERTRAKGTKLGRPSLAPIEVKQIRLSLDKGLSIRKAAKKHGVSTATIMRVKKEVHTSMTDRIEAA